MNAMPAVEMEVVPGDPDTLRRWNQFEANSNWFESHASEVYQQHRGKHICIAGQELFVADSAEEALAKGTTAHPDDLGRFVHYIPREKVARVYAH